MTEQTPTKPLCGTCKAVKVAGRLSGSVCLRCDFGTHTKPEHVDLMLWQTRP